MFTSIHGELGKKRIRQYKNLNKIIEFCVTKELKITFSIETMSVLMQPVE